jgi:cytochrome oxidase assembly protein ShyY1
VYRFLASPGWLARAAVALALAAVMALLGQWQLDRYRERSEVNARIDAGTAAPARPLTELLPPPTGEVGAAPPDSAAWTRVTVTGRYDPGREILVRGRTLDGVGFEVLTPLVLADGTAVLVDRGWLPADRSGAATVPSVPPAPGGEVSVVGRLRRPESGGDSPAAAGGRLQVRRIAPARLATALPYPVYGGYVTAEEAPDGLRPVPPRRERAWQNGGYALQWWVFAVGTLVGFGYLARRQARGGTAASDPVRAAP